MDPAISEQNDRADQLFSQGEFSAALSQYQRVFLDGGKSSEADVRVQVARALRGAALCYDRMGQANMAAQIVQTLAKRYGGDTDPRTRYWVELAQGASTLPPPVEMTAPTSSNAETTWEDFLKANDLEAIPDAEEELETRLSIEPEYPDNKQSTRSVPSPIPSSTGNSAPPQLIPENEISLKRLQQIFENAFFECENDGDALRIQMEGARFLLHLDEKNKLVACAAIYALKESGTPEEKNELANTLNRELILIRFVIHDDTTFVAQYSLSYAHGLMPFHLVNALRLMQRVLTQSVAEYDTNDLLL